MPQNDNDPAVRMPGSDPHGSAALLLVESLLHGLLERSVISIEDAVEIVERADSVQVDLALVADGAAQPMWEAHTLLVGITNSLRVDHRKDPDAQDPSA